MQCHLVLHAHLSARNSLTCFIWLFLIIYYTAQGRTRFGLRSLLCAPIETYAYYHLLCFVGSICSGKISHIRLWTLQMQKRCSSSLGPLYSPFYPLAQALVKSMVNWSILSTRSLLYSSSNWKDKKSSGPNECLVALWSSPALTFSLCRDCSQLGWVTRTQNTPSVPLSELDANMAPGSNAELQLGCTERGKPVRLASSCPALQGGFQWWAAWSNLVAVVPAFGDVCGVGQRGRRKEDPGSPEPALPEVPQLPVSWSLQ